MNPTGKAGGRSCDRELGNTGYSQRSFLCSTEVKFFQFVLPHCVCIQGGYTRCCVCMSTSTLVVKVQYCNTRTSASTNSRSVLEGGQSTPSPKFNGCVGPECHCIFPPWWLLLALLAASRRLVATANRLHQSPPSYGCA